MRRKGGGRGWVTGKSGRGDGSRKVDECQRQRGEEEKKLPNEQGRRGQLEKVKDERVNKQLLFLTGASSFGLVLQKHK